MENKEHSGDVLYSSLFPLFSKTLKKEKKTLETEFVFNDEYSGDV